MVAEGPERYRVVGRSQHGTQRVAVLDGGLRNGQACYEAPGPHTFCGDHLSLVGVLRAPAGVSWHEKTLWLGTQLGSEGPWFDLEENPC